MNSVLNIALVLRDSASRGLEKAAGAVAQLGTMGLEAARKLEAVGGALEGAFDESLTLYERVMGKGVDSAAELEKAMARLEMNLDAGSLTLVDDLERARVIADQIGATTPFNTTEIMDTMTEMRKAGISLEGVMGGGVGAVTSLAAAEDIGLADATEAMLVVRSKLGVEEADMPAIADLMARYGGASSAGAVDMAQGLSQMTVKDLGVSAEDTFALLAINANAGLKGSAGGTAGNAFLRQLTKLDKNTGGKLSAFDENDNFKGMEQVTEELRAYFSTLTQEQQQVQANDLFGDEGKGTLFNLLNTGRGSFEEVQAAAGEGRTLDSKMEVLSRGLMAQQEALGGSVESTLSRLFEPALTPLTKLNQALNEGVSGLGAAAAENDNIALGATGATAMLVALGSLYAFGKAGQSSLAVLGKAGGGVAGGFVAGQVAEELGAQPVFVVNWPAASPLGALSAATSSPVPAGMAPTGAAGALAKAVPVVAAGAAGVAVGTAIDQVVFEDGGKMEKLLHGLIGASMSLNPTRMVLSDETNKINDDAMVAAITLVGNAVMNFGRQPQAIEVTVDGQPTQPNALRRGR